MNPPSQQEQAAQLSQLIKVKEADVEQTFEVELDYGEDGPDEGEPTPTEEDIAQAVREGLERQGFSSVDVVVHRL